ncbi:DNA (cytosine-5-)-methyltransferase [Nocardia sp. NPDC019219]|uniref:DNA cytosine methyltransferase n=1 Tax=Nocardia sp. NPDC019219 TaxID=3154590 RepID=UPI0033E74A90
MPTSIELFAGGGGLALGLHEAGFEHEQLVELNPAGCAILRENARRDPNLWKEENIREMDVRRWLAEIPDLGLPDIDLIAGGPPCQPFSASGKRAGVNDKRDMFPSAIEAVRIIRPKMFAFENVPGLLRADFKPYYDYIVDFLANPDVSPLEDERWEDHHARIKSASLTDVRYHVFRQEMNAADFGVAQIRKRVFIIGFRSDVLDAEAWKPIPKTHSVESLLRSQWIDSNYWPTHGIAIPSTTPEQFRPRIQSLRRRMSAQDPELETLLSLERWRTVRDEINGLPEPIDYVEHPDVPNHWGIPNARIYKGHTGSAIDWPAKVLKAGSHGVCGGEAMIRFHHAVRKKGNKLRYFTIREAARMQSFPDDYLIPGSRTAAMKALGNAVAVDVAAAVGRHLLQLSGLPTKGSAP